MYLQYWSLFNSLTSDNIVILAGGSNPQSQRAANNTFIIAIRSESAGFEVSHQRKSNCKIQKYSLHCTLRQAKPSYSTPRHSSPPTHLHHATPHHSTPLTPFNPTQLHSTPLHPQPRHYTPLYSILHHTTPHHTPLHSTHKPLHSTQPHSTPPHSLHSTSHHSTALHYTHPTPLLPHSHTFESSENLTSTSKVV